MSGKMHDTMGLAEAGLPRDRFSPVVAQQLESGVHVRTSEDFYKISLVF